ncbi:polymer-forming cytoskeletal protein [Enterobacteriaceae bacterium ESL0689]|nr:polymer-forming cytoskeletal protein [Enterobacteriaceae bacterium ESL0689]
MNSENNKQNLFFYSASAAWLISLLSWAFGFTLLSLATLALALTAFLFYGLQRRKMNMFGKSKLTPESPVEETMPQPTESQGEISKFAHQKNTIIGADVHVEGNLTIADQIYIHGSVTGDIHASGGIVKVMSSGSVQGNIVCSHLIVDGRITGECLAEDIEIAERGSITGNLTYTSLCVKKGGVFIGGANMFKEQDRASVTELILTTEEELTA